MHEPVACWYYGDYLFRCGGALLTILYQVVSYDFKKQRFSDMHRRALRFPASQFSFVGVPTSPTSQVAAIQGELKVQEMFQKDPYGCRGDLRSKRMYRDPFLRTVPYPVGCPEIRGLFGYCGSDAYSANLPWDH